MRELIYSSKKVENLIKEQYPQAKIQDASDYIHTERFEVEVDVPKKEFYLFALREGFAQDCFGFLIRAMQEDKEIKQWMDEAETRT